MYTLEKVLKMKKDTVSQVVFLDEAMKVIDMPLYGYKSLPLTPTA